MNTLRRLVVATAVVLALTTIGSAHYAHGQRWRNGTTVTMHLQQGTPSAPLLDGTRDWNAVTEGALSTWNDYLNGVAFSVVRDSSAGTTLRNNTNNVYWADDDNGEDFGDAVAITRWTYRVSDNSIVEADVVFDRGRSWNSYRGNLRSASAGGTLIDLRRVALHEFGHALGLGHPDEHGQSVSAVMNSRVSNVDSLQNDDINGVRSIYGSTTTTTQPAASDTLRAGSRLTVGQTLVSANRRYRLLFQSDGNLVLYDDVDRTAPWASNTGGISAGSALLQGDGNFVVYDAQGAGRWSTSTAGYSNTRLVLQNDGNLVLYSNTDSIWDRNR